ncbi:hypothetical protein SAMN04488074_13653, partial [Lentzea albidocapillata subsp. violacea]
MTRRDIVSDVCNIVCPLPDNPGEDASEDARDAFSVELDIAIDAQERLRGEIEAAWEGGDVDPL